LAKRGNSAAALQRLQPAEFGVVLGVALARNMGVVVGDVVSLVLPSGDLTAMGLMPRTKTLTVVGVFDSGHFEYDSGMAFLHVNDMQRLMRMTGPTGVRVALDDVHLAGRVAQSLQSFLGPDVWVTDWTQQNRNWFAAVQVEKRMMGIILTLIVAVAAFNLVSTLVMTVTDKRADIAILRTLGATPGSIMAIFMVQGAVAGVLGTLFGLLLGLSVALNLDVIVPAIEAVLGVSFLPQEIYLINQMPSDPQSADIVPVVWTSLLLAFVATLYPSWRASQVQPAEALRYE
jgi:lipoprotein-releasing system permease protein